MKVKCNVKRIAGAASGGLPAAMSSASEYIHEVKNAMIAADDKARPETGRTLASVRMPQGGPRRFIRASINSSRLALSAKENETEFFVSAYL
jgi:hypothetical protein